MMLGVVEGIITGSCLGSSILILDTQALTFFSIIRFLISVIFTYGLGMFAFFPVEDGKSFPVVLIFESEEYSPSDSIIFYYVGGITGLLIAYFIYSLPTSFSITLAIVVSFIVLLMIRVGVLIFADIINKEELIELDSEPQPLLHTYIMFASQVRDFLRKSRVWAIPKYEGGNYWYDYREQMNRASSLCSSIENNLGHTPVSIDKKTIFKNQTNILILNINKTLWKRFRTRKLHWAINHDTPQSEKLRENAGNMTRKIELEVSRSLDILSAVSLSLLSVELAHDEAKFDRLINILNHSNDRLQKISEAYLASKHYS